MLKTLKTIPRRYIIGGLLFLIIGIGGFWWWSQRQIEPEYNTLTVKPDTLISTVDVSGVVESERKVTLKAVVAAQISKRLVLENQRQRINAPLLALDNSQYQLQVNQARVQKVTSESQARTELALAQKALNSATTQAQYNQVNLNNQWQKAEESLFFLKREQERSARLFQQKVVSSQTFQQTQQQVDQAILDLKNAKNRLDQATANKPEVISARQRVTQAEQALQTAQQQGKINLALPENNLRQSRVIAPFTGSITRWLVNRGDYATPGTPLAEFQDLQDVRLVLPLNELDFPRVAPGAPVEITFDAYPDRPYQGSVVSMSMASIEGTDNVQSYPIRVWFNNTDAKIKPGMSGDAQITATRKDNVLSVPLSAVERKENLFRIKILTSKNKVEERDVEVGLSTLDSIEITRGLKAGDRVILGPKKEET